MSITGHTKLAPLRPHLLPPKKLNELLQFALIEKKKLPRVGKRQPQNLSSSMVRSGRELFSACEFRLMVAVSISTKDFDSTFGVWQPLTLFVFVNVPCPFESNLALVWPPVNPLVLNDECRLIFGRSSLVGRLEY